MKNTLLFVAVASALFGCIHTDRQTRLEKRQADAVQVANAHIRFEEEQRRKLLDNRDEGLSIKEIAGGAAGIAEGIRDNLRSRKGR